MRRSNGNEGWRRYLTEGECAEHDTEVKDAERLQYCLSMYGLELSKKNTKIYGIRNEGAKRQRAAHNAGKK